MAGRVPRCPLPQRAAPSPAVFFFTPRASDGRPSWRSILDVVLGRGITHRFGLGRRVSCVSANLPLADSVHMFDWTVNV